MVLKRVVRHGISVLVTACLATEAFGQAPFCTSEFRGTATYTGTIDANTPPSGRCTFSFNGEVLLLLQFQEQGSTASVYLATPQNYSNPGLGTSLAAQRPASCQPFGGLGAITGPALSVTFTGNTFSGIRQFTGSDGTVVVQQATGTRNGDSISGTISYSESGGTLNRSGTVIFTFSGVTYFQKSITPIAVSAYKQFDAMWANDPYDHIFKSNGDPETIRSKGCALTSLAMISTLTPNSHTPKELNALLSTNFTDSDGDGTLDGSEATYGYATGGAVIWGVLKKATSNLLTFKGKRAFDKPRLDLELCAGRPVILSVNNATHFVLATGADSSGYLIEDPGHANINHLSSYENTATGMYLFGAPGSGLISISVPAGFEALLRDPLGRRTGFDAGGTLTEIPESGYTQEALADDDPSDGTSGTTVNRVLTVHHPAEGVYQLQISATATTAGRVDVYRFDASDHPQKLMNINASLGGGQSASYSFTYSSTVGDLDGNGVVDGADAAVVAQSIGTSQGTAGYDPVADINDDGDVNETDLDVVGGTLPAAQLAVSLNDNAYSVGETMSATATLGAGPVTGPVDAYIVVRLPSGQFLSLQLNGSFVAGIVPIARGFNPFAFQGIVANYTFSGGEPTGTYTWLAALTQPGTLNVISQLHQLNFTVP